jgi:hypothetical protein
VGNGLWSSLLQVCKAWEASARRVRHGTRLVLLRTGIVLDGEEGGSLGMSLEPHHSLPITLLNAKHESITTVGTKMYYSCSHALPLVKHHDII